MIPPSEFPIDILCLSEPEARELRALFQEWRSAYGNPDSPIERALLEHAVLALFEKRRLFRLRATLQTERARTAELFWQRAIEDDVYKWDALLSTNSSAAMNGLERSAAGMRELIKKWEHLERRLAEDNTWYGQDRITALQLQGYPWRPLDLYYQEAAYTMWLHCMAAECNPKQHDIDFILSDEIMPQRLQDKGMPIWPQDPDQSRQKLRDLVTRELTRLRREEQDLRVCYEEPARAAAKVLALARLTKEDVQLQRQIRSAEQALAKASFELIKARKLMATSWPSATDGDDEPESPEPPHAFGYKAAGRMGMGRSEPVAPRLLEKRQNAHAILDAAGAKDGVSSGEAVAGDPDS